MHLASRDHGGSGGVKKTYFMLCYSCQLHLQSNEYVVKQIEENLELEKNLKKKYHDKV